MHLVAHLRIAGVASLLAVLVLGCGDDEDAYVGTPEDGTFVGGSLGFRIVDGQVVDLEVCGLPCADPIGASSVEFSLFGAQNGPAPIGAARFSAELRGSGFGDGPAVDVTGVFSDPDLVFGTWILTDAGCSGASRGEFGSRRTAEAPLRSLCGGEFEEVSLEPGASRGCAPVVFGAEPEEPCQLAGRDLMETGRGDSLHWAGEGQCLSIYFHGIADDLRGAIEAEFSRIASLDCTSLCFDVQPPADSYVCPRPEALSYWTAWDLAEFESLAGHSDSNFPGGLLTFDVDSGTLRWGEVILAPAGTEDIGTAELATRAVLTGLGFWSVQDGDICASYSCTD